MSDKLEEIAERFADKILDLESIADEEDGCEHTEDGSGITCWNCRKARYELAGVAALQQARDLGREEERVRISNALTSVLTAEEWTRACKAIGDNK